MKHTVGTYLLSFQVQSLCSNLPLSVMHLRTTNAWGMDLAVTCTFFPHCMLTFAVVFGCTPPIETEIHRRMDLAGEYAAHPLLVPGIIAELERARHAAIVDDTISRFETLILEVDATISDCDILETEAAQSNVERRDEWRAMLYLRNHLISWKAQLRKMIVWAEESGNAVLQGSRLDSIRDGSPFVAFEQSSGPGRSLSNHSNQDAETAQGSLERARRKICDRLREIEDGYDEKIRSCMTEMDGMAMAT